MNIVGTGLSGLVGSRVTELLSSSYICENLSKETGTDITDEQDMTKKISESDAPWIFHFAAFTDVQAAEKDRGLGESSPAWQVNVKATQHIAHVCQETGKRLLYLSTDYVFDGIKDSYQEDDTPHPLGWYARTKYEGEKAVLGLGDHGLVVRLANPYRSFRPHLTGKVDVVHKIRERLSAGLPVTSPTDQYFTMTFIDDLANGIDLLVRKNASGIYHIPGGDVLTPYDAMHCIATVFGLDTALITPTTFEQFFAGRAPIPKHGALEHGKIDALGLSLHTFEAGLHEVKKQETVSLKEE